MAVCYTLIVTELTRSLFASAKEDHR